MADVIWYGLWVLAGALTLLHGFRKPEPPLPGILAPVLAVLGMLLGLYLGKAPEVLLLPLLILCGLGLLPLVRKEDGHGL